MCIGTLHSVLKGRQPNLVAIVRVIDVNQATKESQKKQNHSLLLTESL